MEKVPTIFERDWDNDRSRVLDTPVPGCEWVLEGFGVPTRKYDGTCVMFDGKQWWARREVKPDKEPPPGFVSVGHDHITLKNIGWEPIEQSPFAKFFQEALERLEHRDETDDADARREEFLAARGETTQGTYELIGPKINKNPEGVPEHQLILHANAPEVVCPGRTFEAIKAVLETNDIEGIVFHNADGRMAKIKKRDFGLKRS